MTAAALAAFSPIEVSDLGPHPQPQFGIGVARQPLLQRPAMRLAPRLSGRWFDGVILHDVILQRSTSRLRRIRSDGESTSSA